MKLSFEFRYTQEWKKSKAAKTVHTFFSKSMVEVEVAEPEENEFPLVAQEMRLQDDSSYKSKEIRFYNEKLWIPTAISLDDLPAKINRQKKVQSEQEYPDLDKITGKDPVFLGNTREKTAEKIRYNASRLLIYEGVVWRVSPEPMYRVSLNGDELKLYVEYPDVIMPTNFSALERKEAILFGKEMYCRQHRTLQGLKYDLGDMLLVHLPSYIKRFPHLLKDEAIEKHNLICKMCYLFGKYMAKDMLKDCSYDLFMREVEIWAEDYMKDGCEQFSLDEFFETQISAYNWRSVL